MREIFDRRLLRRRRDRAAPRIAEHDFLYTEVEERLQERLSLIKRDFPLTVRMGGASAAAGGLRMDVSEAMRPALVADEEFLPFTQGSLDAVVSNLNLHWTNDLPGALVQIRRALKPDGLFLAALLGGETLHELRQSLLEAELEVTGGASPRVSPFIDPYDMGALLQRAGYALPVVDSDKIIVRYSSLFRLMLDLRGMGAGNAVLDRLSKPTRRGVLLRAAELFAEKFGGDATFHVVYAIGWAPAETQPQPLKRGSAQQSLAQVLGSKEG